MEMLLVMLVAVDGGVAMVIIRFDFVQIAKNLG
jgi:hypothetical protein